MPLGVDFWMIVDGFWEANGAKLVLKFDEKSISTSEGPFYKKYYKTNGISMIFWVSEAEVESKNRSKIDQKTQAKREAIGASIFDEFWMVLGAKLGGKMEQKSRKKALKKR